MFFLSWITPIIALLIKIESSGPVFFKQTRNGIKYKEFTCYKFRSMVENIDADIQQATKNDKRVTKIGKILRKTSLDELPQFYNVLIGNMSSCRSKTSHDKRKRKVLKISKQVYGTSFC